MGYVRPKRAKRPANRPKWPSHSLRRRVWTTRFLEIHDPGAFDEHFFNGLLDLQYLYGLARAGRTEAARALLHNITTHAATRTEAHERTVWQQVCLPAAHGLLAHAQGDWATAVERLGVALPRLVEIGGSHAQRDLFHQIWLDALQRNGQWAAVQNLLQPLCNAQPQSARLARQARRVNQALGLPDPAPQDFE